MDFKKNPAYKSINASTPQRKESQAPEEKKSIIQRVLELNSISDKIARALMIVS